MVATSSNVSDSHWDWVHNALANPKFEFRTVAGIARETGLDADEIQKLLSQHEEKVRIAYSTDKEGRLLYTPRARSQKFREVISNVKTIVSSSSSST